MPSPAAAARRLGQPCRHSCWWRGVASVCRFERAEPGLEVRRRKEPERLPAAGLLQEPELRELEQVASRGLIDDSMRPSMPLDRVLAPQVLQNVAGERRLPMVERPQRPNRSLRGSLADRGGGRLSPRGWSRPEARPTGASGARLTSAPPRSTLRALASLRRRRRSPSTPSRRGPCSSRTRSRRSW